MLQPTDPESHDERTVIENGKNGKKMAEVVLVVIVTTGQGMQPTLNNWIQREDLKE